MAGSLLLPIALLGTVAAPTSSLPPHHPTTPDTSTRVADAVAALPRPSLEQLLLLAAAEHPGVAARLLAHAAAPTVTAISHPRVALDGDATASAVGRLVTIHGTGFVAG